MLEIEDALPVIYDLLLMALQQLLDRGECLPHANQFPLDGLQTIKHETVEPFSRHLLFLYHLPPSLNTVCLTDFLT